jgi:hypothetical protein
MSKSLILSALLCGVALVYASAPQAAADPSVHQIYEAAQSGRIAEAEQMVEQVLQDNPRSGKAHYVAAEIFARGGNFPRARSELSTAEQIDPGLPFVTNPTAVSSLKRELAANHVPQGFGAYERPRSGSGLPWGGILLVMLGIGVVWMFIRRRVQASSYGSYAGNIAPGPGQPGYGTPGAGPAPYYPGGGGGSGLMGSLGTGLAIGAGVAAGEELVHHVLDGDRSGGVINSSSAGELGDVQPQNSNMGGNDFGVGDSNSWSDSSGSSGDDGGSFDSGVGGDDWT